MPASVRPPPGSKRRHPFASPIPNVQHVDPLFAFVSHEVNVALRFFKQHAFELRSPARRGRRAGIADRLEVLDHFPQLVEEKLGVIGVRSPVRVDFSNGTLRALR